MIATVVLAVMCSLSPPSPSCSAGDALEAVYRRARTYDKNQFRYAAPPAQRLTELRALVAALARAASASAATLPKDARAHAQSLGFTLTTSCDARGPLWALHEADERREGGGLYVLRPGGLPVCIQAPHTFFDQGTGELALAAFTELGAACLFTNTVHRYSEATTGASEHPIDVAHAPGTLFQAANEGLLEAVRWPVVQVHGFGPREEVGPDDAAVVSNGTAQAGRDATATRLRAALATRLAPRPVRLYGVDARVLGATTNVQGQAVRARGLAFLHMELSAAVRQQLRASSDRGGALLAGAIREALRLPAVSAPPAAPR